MISVCGKCLNKDSFLAKVGEVHRVRCGNPNCGAAGGSSPDPDEAIRLWNRQYAVECIYEMAELRMDREACLILKDIINEVLNGKS